MYLSITKDGKLYQADGASNNGKGFGRFPTRVDEGSVVLSDGKALLARQLAQKNAQTLGAAKVKYLNDVRKNKQEVMNRFDEARRRQVMLGQPQKQNMTNTERVIKKELMRQMSGSADFQQLERMKGTGDFGSDADFRTYDTVGNPLTRDGSYGTVTDFERTIKGLPFSTSVGAIPTGMTNNGGLNGNPNHRGYGTAMAAGGMGTSAMGNQLAERRRLEAARFKGKIQTGFGRRSVSVAQALGKAFGDDLSDQYAAADAAASGPVLDEFGNPVGTVQYTLTPGQNVYDEYGNVIQTGSNVMAPDPDISNAMFATPSNPSGQPATQVPAPANAQPAPPPMIAAPTPSTPSFWDSITGAAQTAISSPQVQAQVTAAAQKLITGATSTPSVPSVVPKALIPTYQALQAPMTIPGTKIQISRGMFLFLLLGAGGATYVIIKRRRKK